MPQRVLRKEANGYAVLVVLLVAVSLTVASLVISLSVNRNSERKFCNVVISQRDQAGGQISGLAANPPATDAGRAIEQQWKQSYRTFEDLRRDLGCPARTESE